MTTQMKPKSDTPETDAVIGGADVWNAFEEDIIALARHLEHERNELRVAIQTLKEWQEYGRKWKSRYDEMIETCRICGEQRDELRRLLELAQDEIVKANDSKQPTTERGT